MRVARVGVIAAAVLAVATLAWAQQTDFLAHLLLPILVATFGGLAGFSRYMRQSMLEVVRQELLDPSSPALERAAARRFPVRHRPRRSATWCWRAM